MELDILYEEQKKIIPEPKKPEPQKPVEKKKMNFALFMDNDKRARASVLFGE